MSRCFWTQTTGVVGAVIIGVRFRWGDLGQSIHALTQDGGFVDKGKFSLQIGTKFAPIDVGKTRRDGETGGH